MKDSALAKLGTDLEQLYQAYQSGGTTSPEFQELSARLRVEGDRVGIDVRASGSLTSLIAALENIGMAVEATDPTTSTVEGLIPIGRLADLAAIPEATGITPIYRPATGSGGFAATGLFR